MAHHHIMVTKTGLRDVCGRVEYISSEKKQEYLEAFFSTTDNQFWNDLAKHCQKQSRFSKTKKTREGIEFMIPLANELYRMDPNELAKILSDKFAELTGTENAVALHWNKRRNNYHTHVIVAENKRRKSVALAAPLTRNTYYDANGKRSTKQECLDADGNLKEGCAFYKKGEVIHTDLEFESKNMEIASQSFLIKVKKEMCAFQNELLQEDRFTVFDKNGPYIAHQHVGKNKTLEQQEAIRAKNALVSDFNKGVDEILTEASKNGPEAVQKAQEDILMWRQEIKPHKMTNRWLKYIELQIKKIQQRIRNEIKRRLGIEEPAQEDLLKALEAQEAFEGLGSSLDDKIALGTKKVAQNASQGSVRPSKGRGGR